MPGSVLPLKDSMALDVVKPGREFARCQNDVFGPERRRRGCSHVIAGLDMLPGMGGYIVVSDRRADSAGRPVDHQLVDQSFQRKHQKPSPSYSDPLGNFFTIQLASSAGESAKRRGLWLGVPDRLVSALVAGPDRRPRFVVELRGGRGLVATAAMGAAMPRSGWCRLSELSRRSKDRARDGYGARLAVNPHQSTAPQPRPYPGGEC
jgi:hypothetical protein